MNDNRTAPNECQTKPPKIESQSFIYYYLIRHYAMRRLHSSANMCFSFFLFHFAVFAFLGDMTNGRPVRIVRKMHIRHANMLVAMQRRPQHNTWMAFWLGRAAIERRTIAFELRTCAMWMGHSFGTIQILHRIYSGRKWYSHAHLLLFGEETKKKKNEIFVRIWSRLPSHATAALPNRRYTC